MNTPVTKAITPLLIYLVPAGNVKCVKQLRVSRAIQAVTLGGINCFDTMQDAMSAFGGLDTMAYDPRGRLWFGKMSLSF